MATNRAGDCQMIVSMPDHWGGATSIVAALGKAKIEVTRIEPQGGGPGIYHLIVDDRPLLAASVLKGMGCLVLGVAGA